MKKTTSRKGKARAQTPQRDLYQTVTDKIVAAMEKGVAPWRKPWRTDRSRIESSLPTNAVTGNAYSGVNVLLLWLAAEEGGYTANRWLTYRQAQDAGGHVCQGEACSLGVFFKPWERQAKDADGTKLFDADGDAVMDNRPVVRALNLFNVEQCEGLPQDMLGSVQPQDAACVYPRDQAAFNRVQLMQMGSGVSVKSWYQNRAYYNPVTDQITLPTFAQFDTEADYWTTLLHELVHATGHRNRLSREGITASTRQFGDPRYGFEELIAELGSAYLCAELGIYGECQHEDYLAGWLKVLKDDKQAIFRASRFAREASAYLMQPVLAKAA